MYRTFFLDMFIYMDNNIQLNPNEFIKSMPVVSCEEKDVHLVLAFTEIDQQLGTIKITTVDTYKMIIDRINNLLHQSNLLSTTEFYFIRKGGQIVFVNTESSKEINLIEDIPNIVTIYVNFDDNDY